MPFIDPFAPATAASTTIGVTNTSAFTVCPGDGESVELNNLSANTVFIETTNGSVAATVAASYPVQAGHCKTIKLHSGDSGIAAIASVAGPSTLIVTRGNGS